jgi:hypothetical protein
MIKSFLNLNKYLKGMIMDNMEISIKWVRLFGLLNLVKIQIEVVEFKFAESYSKLKKLLIIQMLMDKEDHI